MADTLPQTIRNIVLGNNFMNDTLALYPLDDSLAVFQSRAPSDHEGFPYITFLLNESALSTDQHYLKRNVELRFDVWGLNEGHSYTFIQPIVRELTTMFDRQRIEDSVDYESARAFLQGTHTIEEPDEEDNIVRMMVLFNILAYRKFMQTFLVGS